MLYHPKNLSTRSKSISNIFSTQDNFLSPKQIDFKRRCLIEKFSEALKAKHLQLFKEKNYTKSMLNADLNQLVSYSKLEEIDYNSYILTLEKEILQKLQNAPNAANLISTSVFENNMMNTKASENPHANANTNNNLPTFSTNRFAETNISKPNNEVLSLENCDQYEASNLNQILSQKNLKVKALRFKEKDEWGKQTKINYNKFLEENCHKRSLSLEKNKLLSKMLEKQSQEKKSRDAFENNDDHFLAIQREIIKMQEESDLKARTFMKQKNMENEISRKSFLKVKNRSDKEKLENERKIEQDLIHKYKEELQLEKEKQLKKKELEIFYMKKSFEQVNLKNSINNEEKIKQKIEEEKIERERKERQDKQDRDRELFLINVKTKIQNCNKNDEEYNKTVFTQNNLKRQFEEKRFKKDVEEVENRYFLLI